uniref:NADH dehydrogenase subunit 6 n=1 Tax=Colobopsis nipponica TaxID=2681982 RepID=A0A7S7BHS0_9HYME|nr:NADH dehydrogenase subunit 6 [Colobopsis nipponica]QOW83446.1 NADH dehydrogenase subunit 6 [Colobopsis nipponica]
MMNMTKIHLLNFLTIFLILIVIMFMIMNLNNHPIIMMIILLIYSSLICINMCLWKSNYLYSIFLFLMMISGLLIIFLYFSSLISNEQLKFNYKFIYYMILMNFLLFILTYKKIKSLSNMFIYKYSFNEITPILNINNMKFNNIMNLFEYPLNNITIMTMFYLLFSLFSIIKICSTQYLSLRKIN